MPEALAGPAEQLVLRRFSAAACPPRALRRIGRAPWLHAAQSYFHDVTPARKLGIPVAWINRHGEPPHGEALPDREFRTLEHLADWLTGDRNP